MAYGKASSQAQLSVDSPTNVLWVTNTSGADLGNILLTNVHPANQIQAFVSIVPTGSTMSSGNAILWNVGVGASGVLSITQPSYLPSGHSLQASGSAAGMNIYVTYLKYN